MTVIVTPILVFDIETIPDAAGIRKLSGCPNDMPDGEVVERAFAERREKTGSDFLPHYLHRVVAISCVYRNDKSVRVRSLGALGDSEANLVQAFFDIIEKYTPQLVSWNGSGFDLPVLHYRGLIHNVHAACYWDMGESDREFKWNNYISRYHTRHLDLMDMLAAFQPRANAPLDALAKLCGFPGKLGMDGGQVWQAFQQGRLAEIRAYCETDVVNTYLLYCKYQLMRGYLNADQYADEIALVKSTLADESGVHWAEYLSAFG